MRTFQMDGLNEKALQKTLPIFSVDFFLKRYFKDKVYVRKDATLEDLKVVMPNEYLLNFEN